MSWDVLLIKTETNKEEIEEITTSIPFNKSDFIRIVEEAFPDTDTQDETWLILDSQYYSIEFNIGKENDPETIMLHIRGGNEPSDVISYLCAKLCCRAYDITASEFMETGKKSGFQDWKQYRDQVMEKINEE